MASQTWCAKWQRLCEGLCHTRCLGRPAVCELPYFNPARPPRSCCCCCRPLLWQAVGPPRCAGCPLRPQHAAYATARDVAAGLAHLHGTVGRVHRDLNTANILLHPDGSAPCGFVARIIDFGEPGSSRTGPSRSGPASCPATRPAPLRAWPCGLGLYLRPPFPLSPPACWCQHPAPRPCFLRLQG